MKKEKVEKKFKCAHCNHTFTRMVKKIGKKVHYTFCSEMCRDETGSGTVEQRIATQTKMHKKAKRDARRKVK